MKKFGKLFGKSRHFIDIKNPDNEYIVGRISGMITVLSKERRSYVMTRGEKYTRIYFDAYCWRYNKIVAYVKNKYPEYFAQAM